MRVRTRWASAFRGIQRREVEATSWGRYSSVAGSMTRISLCLRRRFTRLIEALAGLIADLAALPPCRGRSRACGSSSRCWIVRQVLVEVVGDVQQRIDAGQSAVRKAADLGRPRTGPRMASTSSMR